MKGIKIFGNEIKVSQFADELFCADLTAIKYALRTVGEFGVSARLRLHVKSTKGFGLASGRKKNQPFTAEIVSYSG